MDGLSTGRQRRSRFAKGRVACVVLLVGAMLAMCAFEKSMSFDWRRENPELVDDVFEQPGDNNSSVPSEQLDAANSGDRRPVHRRTRSSSLTSPPHSLEASRSSNSERSSGSSSSSSSSRSRRSSSGSERGGRRSSSGSDVEVFGPRWSLPWAGGLQGLSIAGGNTGGETRNKRRPLVWSPYGERPEGTRLYELNKLDEFDFIPCDLSREQGDIQGKCMSSWLELSTIYNDRELITQVPWDNHNTILRKLEQWLQLRQPKVILTNCQPPTELDVDYQCMGNISVMAKSKALLEEGGKSYVRDVTSGVGVYNDTDGELLHRCYLDVTVKFDKGVNFQFQDHAIAGQMRLIRTAGWKLWNGGRKGVFLLPFEVDEEELRSSNSLSLRDPKRGIFKIENTLKLHGGRQQQFPCGKNSRMLSLEKGVTIRVLAVRHAAPFLATPPKVAKNVIHLHIETKDDEPVNMNPQRASKTFFEGGLWRSIQLFHLKLKEVETQAMKEEVNDFAFKLRLLETVNNYTFFVSSPTLMYGHIFARQLMLYVPELTFERVAALFRFLITPHKEPDKEAATTRDEKNILQLPTPNIAVWLSYPRVRAAFVLYSDAANKGGCLYTMRIKFWTDQYELQLKATMDKKSRIRLERAKFAEIILHMGHIEVFERLTKEPDENQQDPPTIMMPGNGTLTLMRRKVQGAEAPTITCGGFPVTFEDSTNIEMRFLPIDVRTNHTKIYNGYNDMPRKYPADPVPLETQL